MCAYTQAQGGWTPALTRVTLGGSEEEKSECIQHHGQRQRGTWFAFCLWETNPLRLEMTLPNVTVDRLCSVFKHYMVVVVFVAPPPHPPSLQQPSILLYEAVRMVWRRSLSVLTPQLHRSWCKKKKKMSEADLLSLNNHDCIAVFDRQHCRCVSQGWILYGARWAVLLINKLKSPSSIPDELIRGSICSLACGRCTWFN